MKSYDVIGNIAILKFPEKTRTREKKKTAESVLNKQKNIKTILEKIERVKGKLRTIKTSFLLGNNTRETIHKESGGLFKLNVEKCYFSGRMSNDRIEIAKKIKHKDSVLVLFSGVAPYSIIISKLAKPKQIIAIELSRIASTYARENVKLNKLSNIEIIQGDVRKINKLVKGKFDKIVMARPNLKDTFLKYVFPYCKKSTIIFYHGFGEKDKVIKEIREGAKKAGKKIKILGIKKIGEIAPYKYRWRVEIKVV